MSGMPAGSQLLIEFTAGVWTDVTADAEADPISIKRGRTSEFSAVSVGTLDGLRLNNTTGRYTPESQVLVDGSAHPYWPNIQPRKRLKYLNTPAGTRYVGYIKGWPPFVDTNGTAWVMISATDRLDQLARVTLKSAIAQEQSTSGAALSWPLTEPAGSTVAVEADGGQSLTIMDVAHAPLLFGDAGPGFGDGTGVKFSPSSATAGQYLNAPLSNVTLDAFTIEVYVNAGTVLPSWATSGANTENIFGLDTPQMLPGFALFYLTLGRPVFTDGTCLIEAASPIGDGGWHHIAASRTAATGLVTLYVDGVSQGASVAASTWATQVTKVSVGEAASPYSFFPARFQGNVGYAAIYTSALTPAEIATHAQAINGYSGDRTDQRIARFLTAAGLTSADWTLDVGQAAVGTYPEAGKSVVAACQDMATTEGGGAAFYVDMAGMAKFTNRIYRKPGAPVMILDAVADLDGTNYQPSFDELNLTNMVTVTRSALSGTLSTQTAQDLVSQAAYNLSSATVDTFTLDDRDALALAQSQVAAQAWPGFRLPQVSVDLLTAQTTYLYLALANTRIGSRIRVTNLPKAMGPATQVDLIVEGWTEVIAPDQYRVTFDTSPADNPARGVYDDTTYGRYQCSGQTLNAALTAVATVVVIATGAGLPTFTTVSARYPLSIQVGAEILTLTSAPGGASSPQTFTGVTRGVAGTSAAAQASGATVQIFPATTFTL